MPAFVPAVIQGDASVELRLRDFGVTTGQLKAVGSVARMYADDASPLMPINAPGTLAYMYGVRELRQQLLDGTWKVDRSCGIEAVVNREANLRIAFQNVDRSCDEIFPPNPRSAKGSASENLCGPTLFEYAGVDPGPLTGVRQDGMTTYYLMVGEDGSIELSQPIILNGSYCGFRERIFITSSDNDWAEEINPDTGPVDDFDVPVFLKDVG